MWIIDLTPLAPGVYNDHRADHITAPPDGWAVIPDDFPVPSTYPRLGSIEASEIDGVMTVTAMTGGTLPDPEPEHISGDRVTVRLDAGAMPLLGTTKCITHGIESLGKLISLRGTATGGTSFLALPCEGATLYISGKYACIACSADLSGYTDVTVQIEYEVG